MPKTQVRTEQLEDEGVTRSDLNASVAGKAVVRKIIQGTGITLSSTGADAGTGDVTINASGGGGAATAIQSNETALDTTEGAIGWESAKEFIRLYDGQRERAVTSIGWVPYAYPINFVSTSAFTTAHVLAASGGCIAIPVKVDGHLLLQSVSARNTDTSGSRTWSWNLYEQRLNNGNAAENELYSVARPTFSETFTASAASTRTISASAVTYVAPGIYWLVVQSPSSPSFGLGSTAVSAAFAPNAAQTKTLSVDVTNNTNPLDFVAATWTKVTAIYAVRLNGRVFGQTAAF